MAIFSLFWHFINQTMKQVLINQENNEHNSWYCKLSLVASLKRNFPAPDIPLNLWNSELLLSECQLKLCCGRKAPCWILVTEVISTCRDTSGLCLFALEWKHLVCTFTLAALTVSTLWQLWITRRVNNVKMWTWDCVFGRLVINDLFSLWNVQLNVEKPPNQTKSTSSKVLFITK